MRRGEGNAARSKDRARRMHRCGDGRLPARLLGRRWASASERAFGFRRRRVRVRSVARERRARRGRRPRVRTRRQRQRRRQHAARRRPGRRALALSDHPVPQQRGLLLREQGRELGRLSLPGELPQRGGAGELRGPSAVRRKPARLLRNDDSRTGHHPELPRDKHVLGVHRVVLHQHCTRLRRHGHAPTLSRESRLRGRFEQPELLHVSRQRLERVLVRERSLQERARPPLLQLTARCASGARRSSDTPEPFSPVGDGERANAFSENPLGFGRSRETVALARFVLRGRQTC